MSKAIDQDSILVALEGTSNNFIPKVRLQISTLWGTYTSFEEVYYLYPLFRKLFLKFHHVHLHSVSRCSQHMIQGSENTLIGHLIFLPTHIILALKYFNSLHDFISSHNTNIFLCKQCWFRFSSILFNIHKYM